MRSLSIVVLITACFFSCHAPNPDDGKAIFYYNEASGISSLDPAFARSQSTIWAVNQLFNGLVQLNDSLQIEPCIASSWEIRNQGLEYIFHLRRDVLFHDDPLFAGGHGRSVKAPDFVYSFNRILDAAVVSPGLWVFSHVAKDGKAFKAIDDSTLQINLNEAFPPFLSLLTMQYCSVVPNEVVKHYGKEFRTHPIGTGPFVFKFWEEGVRLNMIRNEHYFESENGHRLPYLDAVSIGFIPNRESAFMDFLQGRLDFISGIDGAYKDMLLTREGKLQAKFKAQAMTMQVSPFLNTEYLGFRMDNNPSNPLSIKEIRQAINCGFDRARMISYLRNNIGRPANSGFVPEGIPSFDASKVKGYDYDPARARLLLEKAGFPGGKGLPEIRLGTVASYLDYCQFIQSQLAEIGIKIKVEVNADAMNRELIAKGQQAFFRGSWIADYPDAENYLSLFYSPNFSPQGPNTTHFTNPTFDRWYEQALLETESTQRIILYQKMDSLLLAEAPIVPLYYDQSVRLHHSNITGLGSHPMNLLTLKRVKKTPS